MKPVLIGCITSVVALVAAYGGVMYGLNSAAAAKPQSEVNGIGLQYKKVPMINVPIIAEGAVKGYVSLTVVFTGDAETMARLPVPVEAFVRDEAFRYIYNDPRLNFHNLSKYNVNGMLADVRQNVNKRVGADVLNEILLENINFVDKTDITSKKAPSEITNKEAAKPAKKEDSSG